MPPRLARWLLGLTALAVVTTSAAPDVARITRDLESWIRPLADGGQLAGTLLVAKDGQVIFERSYGFADRERRIPVRPDTRFCVASITKPMTMILAVQLINEKKLGLQDTLSRWIPEFPRSGEITVEHLMRHRAGIPHRVTDKTEEQKPATPADLVRYAARHALMFQPGEKSVYSSGGYSVLARVLELATGVRFGDLLRQRIFAPLGMTRSVDPDERFPLAKRGPSYFPGEQGFSKAPFQDLSFLVGAGSVYSTPRDLHRLLEGVVSGQLGVPVRASLVRNGAVHWNGSTNGFRAFVDWDSASGVAVIFAGNSHVGVNDLVQQALPRIVANQQVEPAKLRDPAMVRLSDDRLKGYQGVYLLGNGVRLEVTARNHRLWANEWMLVPTADSVFFSPRDYGDVRVVAGADRKVERLDWTVGGRTLPAPRVGDLETARAE